MKEMREWHPDCGIMKKAFKLLNTSIRDIIGATSVRQIVMHNFLLFLLTKKFA